MVDPFLMVAAVPFQWAAPWPRCLEVKTMAAGVFTRRPSCLFGFFRFLIHQPELCIVETLKSTWGTRFREIQGVEQPCSQARQKGPRCEASTRVQSSGAQKITERRRLGQYVGATPFGAEMISAPLERNYSIRLLGQAGGRWTFFNGLI